MNNLFRTSIYYYSVSIDSCSKYALLSLLMRPFHLIIQYDLFNRCALVCFVRISIVRHYYRIDFLVNYMSSTHFSVPFIYYN